MAEPRAYVGRWGLYPWFPEDGLDMIAPEDQQRFQALQPYGKVFHCLHADDAYITLQYRDETFRVRAGPFKPLDPPDFPFGAAVVIRKDQTRATIRDIHWHHKEAAHIYYLEVGGKPKSRRYFAGELAAVASDGNRHG